MPENTFLYQLQRASAQEEALVALLIDPDKRPGKSWPDPILQLPDVLLVGGSLLTRGRIDACIRQLRARTDRPVFLFPGHSMQLSELADGILFLSLLSGRNPDYLIGQQVVAAPWLKRSGLEVLPTGYLLIDGGRLSSAAYITQTLPLPRDKPELAAATAQAAELLGLRLLYLEAGSGAPYPVPPGLIATLRQEVDLPLIVGGGLRSPEQVRAAAQAGAAMVVVGTAAEEDPGLLRELAAAARPSSGAADNQTAR